MRTSLFAGLVGLVLLSVVSLGSATAQVDGTVIVANMSDNTVTIFDLAVGAAIATLPTGEAPHEIAISADGATAVVTNYGTRSSPGNSLSVVDLQSLEVVDTIDLGVYQRPHGIAFLPGDSTVAVTSEVEGVVAFVHIHDGKVLKTIATTQRVSHMLAASAGGDRVFTTNIIDGTVSVIDPAADQIESLIRVSPMVEGIAASPDGRTLWVGSNQRKTVNVVDVETGSVTDSLVGFGFPYRMAVTPEGTLAVLSDPMLAEIRIIDTRTLSELARIKVPATGVVAASEFPGSASPEGIAITRDGRYAFVSLQGRNQVGVIDLYEHKLISYLDAGGWPDGIGYSPLQR